jgi:hypothetical protein
MACIEFGCRHAAGLASVYVSPLIMTDSAPHPLRRGALFLFDEPESESRKRRGKEFLCPDTDIRAVISIPIVIAHGMKM